MLYLLNEATTVLVNVEPVKKSLESNFAHWKKKSIYSQQINKYEIRTYFLTVIKEVKEDLKCKKDEGVSQIADSCGNIKRHWCEAQAFIFLSQASFLHRNFIMWQFDLLSYFIWVKHDVYFNP